MNSGRGKIVVISSPSGGGKSSICRALLKRHRKNGWEFSVSYTTRPPRAGEKNGREYFFVPSSAFSTLQKRGFFAESCRVHTYRYGTPRRPLDNILKNGGVILLDVDVKGAIKLRRLYPEAVLLFILPPSRAELRRRLKKRGTEDDKQLKIRLKRALDEMELFSEFEYVVINKHLDVAVDEVDMIIKTLHCRRKNLNLELIRRIIG